MAKLVRIELKGLGKLKAGVVNALNRALSQPKVKIGIGQEVIKQNVRALRTGKSIDGERLPALSKSWIKRRTRLAQFNNTHSLYGPKKSNVTFTGDLLAKGLIIDGINDGSNSVTVKFSNAKHAPYVGVKGKKLKSSKHSDIADGLTKKGWNLLDISQRLENSIKRIITKELKDMLRAFRRRS